MDSARLDAIAELRKSISAIEAKSADMVRKPPAEPSTESPPLAYPGMPEGDDWLQRIPATFVDGEAGFDRRLMEELAAVDVPCYRVLDLAKRSSSVPQGIPIFADWLAHLDDRIPGEETDHRRLIRIGLVLCLRDRAARGKRYAIDAVIGQIHTRHPKPSPIAGYACNVLSFIASAEHADQVIPLLDVLGDEDGGKSFLIQYLGRVNTSEARELAIGYLSTPYTEFALKALIKMNASGVRDLVAPYVDSPHADVRKYARRALERLPG